jgi:hypothetical protein
MKLIVRVGLSVCLALFALAVAEAQDIKTVDGVIVVSSGKIPTSPPGQPTRFTLTEELTVGLSNNPDESFTDVSYLAVDAEGKIYCLDIKDQKIKVFDKNGKFLLAIGKQGQGPGELGLAVGIQITHDNLLMVEDNAIRRLTLFKPTGEFVRNISMADKMSLVSLLLDAQGNYLGRELVIDKSNGKMFFEAKKFDQNLKPLFTLDKIEYPIPDPNSKAKMNYLEMKSIYQFDPEGNIYYGRNKTYDIKIYSPEGKHIRTIEKEYDRIKITQQDIDGMIAATAAKMPGVNYKDLFAFPEYYPPYDSFILDEQGRLFVRTYNKDKAKDGVVVDIFNAEGRFVAQFATKSDLKLFKKNKAYGVEVTADGFLVIKRYAVTWKVK